MEPAAPALPREPQLTRTRRHLADFSLPSFSLAVHATHLRRGRVAEAYPGDVPLTAGHRARGPGGPVAPAAILLDCGRPRTRRQIHHALKHSLNTMAVLRRAASLTSLVTFLGVAVTGLNRSAFAVAVDAVTRASPLLDASAASHRTMGPRRPGGPTIVLVDRCERGTMEVKVIILAPKGRLGTTTTTTNNHHHHHHK